MRVITNKESAYEGVYRQTLRSIKKLNRLAEYTFDVTDEVLTVIFKNRMIKKTGPNNSDFEEVDRACNQYQ